MTEERPEQSNDDGLAPDEAGEEATAAADGCPPTLGSSLMVALRTTFIGAVMLALIEYLTATFVFRDPVGGRFPLLLEVAVIGKYSTTYALVLALPLMLLSLLWYALRGRAQHAAPEPFLLTMFLIIVALVVAPADLDMANKGTLVILIPTMLVVLYLASMAYLVGRILKKRWGRCKLRSAYRNLARVCCLAWLILGGVFWFSALRNAASYEATRPAGSERSGARPDVLWIVLDTARADRMSLYGYDQPTTPKLEAFAKEAVVFDRAIANAIWTLPTHAAMFTGRPFREHGLGKVANVLQPQHKTVAEYLADAGYATGCFTNNPLISSRRQLARGFQDEYNVFNWLRSIRFSLEHLYELSGWGPPLAWFDQDYGAAVTNELVSDWLSRQGDKSVFAFVNLMEVHLPYRVPSSYRKQFMSNEALPRSYALRRSVHGELEDWLHQTAILHGYDDMPQVDRDAITGQYDAAMRYLDDRIAELLELFRANGRLDNTLVIITSDHGEYLDTKGMWSHHFLTYQDVVHIPMILRAPGKPGGTRSNDVVQLTDLAPTVLSATLGPETVPSDWRGRDLLADVQAAVIRPAIAEHYGAGKVFDDILLGKTDRELRHRAARQFAVIEPQYKYIWSSDGMRELYDLNVDPLEQNNLARKLPLEVQRMQRILDAWKQRTPELKPADLKSSGRNPDVLKDLEALGYVGGEDE